LLPAARYKGSCELEYSHEVTGETATGLVQKHKSGTSDQKFIMLSNACATLSLGKIP
jgi:hypothetical protein